MAPLVIGIAALGVGWVALGAARAKMSPSAQGNGAGATPTSDLAGQVGAGPGKVTTETGAAFTSDGLSGKLDANQGTDPTVTPSSTVGPGAAPGMTGTDNGSSAPPEAPSTIRGGSTLDGSATPADIATKIYAGPVDTSNGFPGRCGARNTAKVESAALAENGAAVGAVW